MDQKQIMRVKYLLNLNKNHNIDIDNLQAENAICVFGYNLSPKEYKDEHYLRTICKSRIEYVKSLETPERRYLSFKDPVYVIYSGLAVVMLVFVDELLKKGYKVVVLFEDKDNGGYYKMEEFTNGRNDIK